MKRVLLDGYVTERNEKRVVNGVETEIMTYQGDHYDEYLVREVGSGRCSLFYKGILKYRHWCSFPLLLSFFFQYTSPLFVMNKQATAFHSS